MSPPTERTGPLQEAGPTNHDGTTVPQDVEDWRQRLAQRLADHQARVEAQKALRADLAARRVAGKRIRHARRAGGR
jgi:hypothetical protein